MLYMIVLIMCTAKLPSSNVRRNTNCEENFSNDYAMMQRKLLT